MEATDIKILLSGYRTAIEDHTKMRYALIAFPELEAQISAPLLARQESRVQAAETQLTSAIKRATKGNE